MNITESADTTVSDRERIIEMVMNYRSAKIILVATWYDIFTHISTGKRHVDEIAETIGATPRATEILLNALVALGYLKKIGLFYANRPIAENHLVRGNAGYMGNNLKYQEIIWDAWSDLKNVLQTGKTDVSLQQRIFNDPAFSAEYIRGMKNISRKPAEQIASLVPTSSDARMLDVGAGPGIYSLAFLEKNPRLNATLLDLPPTIAIASEDMRFHSARSRIHFVEGNYHEKDFGSDLYEVVLMSHITHDEGVVENIKLIEKAYAALKKGGKLIIHDFMVNDQKTEPLFSALFSVHMLVYTQAGRVYSVDEYTSWLRDAGFVDVQKHGICQDSATASVALVATRAFT